MNNIVLVSDNKEALEAIESNLMLLRKFDYIFSCDFLSAKNAVAKNRPDVVILYSNIFDERLLEFIKSINSQPILAVGDELSDDDLINIYEAGAEDFITLNHSQAEFLVRVMACMKRSSSMKRASRNEEILTQIGILKKNTTFYSSKYTPAVFKNLIKSHINAKYQDTVLAIAPDIEIKNRCSLDYLANILKENLRDDDVIGFGKEKLYVLLANTNTQGALNVYNKLKSTMPEDYTISAGVLEVKKEMPLDMILKNADSALFDALSLKNNVVVQDDFSIAAAMNWLDKPIKKQKSFKLFKKAFMKKVETVVVPVFYQKQQLAEQRLFETKIEQSSNDMKSTFSLEKGSAKALLEITYPGSVKINIDIFNNINENAEPEHSSYERSQINEKMLGDILDKFIRTFQKMYG